jgi:hypothetical protein
VGPRAGLEEQASRKNNPCPFRESKLRPQARSLVSKQTQLPRIPYVTSKSKSKVVPVLSTEHHAMKAYWGSRGIAPRIIDLGTRWR